MNKNHKDEAEIGFFNLNDKTFNELLIQRPQERDDDIIVLRDMKETFMKLIFEPYRFSKATICKSLRVRNKSSQLSLFSTINQTQI